MSSFMLDSALSYARKGWRVFPLHGIVSGRCTCGKSHEATPKQVGKHPRTRAGFKDATTEFAQITAWWTRWPDTNIGIATGSGLAVIDLDGPAGFAEFKDLVRSHEPIPETLVSKTGNGYHFIFQTREDGPEVRSSARGNVHVRGEGGYIVAPPSLHYSGRRYQWVKCRQLAVMPEWLRQWTQGYEITAPRAVSVLGPLPAYLSSNQRDTTKLLDQSMRTVWSPTEQATLESALQAIDVKACGYEDFLKIGFGLHSLNWDRPDGTSIGFDIWDRWCAQSEHHNQAGLEEKWKSFGRSGRQGVTLGTVYHLAQAHGWNRVLEFGSAKPVNSDLNGHALALPAALTARPIIWPQVNEEGRPRISMKNAMAALLHMGITCRYNRFNYRYMLGGHAIQQYGFDHLVDPVVVVLRNNAIDLHGLDFQKEKIGDALETIGLENHFDPVVDYLEQLAWDGVPRLDKWLSRYLAADDTPLNEQFGRLTLIAAVRRARLPGTKFDQILVLEGREGTGKSQAVRILAGEAHFSDATLLNLTAQAQQENTEGIWIYELSELNGIKRTGAESLKQFASRPDDRARPAYGRYLQTRPRRCIFIGTTNRNDYLISDTGNRRFWPVKTGRVDLEALRRDRDQLWAEAAELERRGNSIVLPERFWSLAGEEQDKRMEADLWFDTIQEYLTVGGAPQESASTHDVLCNRFQIPIGQSKRIEEMRVAGILRRLGYTQRRKCRAEKGSKTGFEYRYFRE